MQNPNNSAPQNGGSVMRVIPDFHLYDGLGLAGLVAKKEVTPLELTEEAIYRIEAYNPVINAVIYKMYDQARSQAKAKLPGGLFSGVPFLIKDSLDTLEGVPTSSGTALLKNIPQAHDSETVKRFREAGLVFVGKTNLPELCLLPVTEPAVFGPAHNPWNLDRTPGGSSGGSAAAVAACIVPVAGGADGGGSIRTPASCCGVFGMKPTRGRVPTGPDHGDIWRGFAQENVLSRSVRDSAAMLDAIAGADVGAPYWAPPINRPYLSETTTEPGRLHIAFTSHPFLGKDVHEDCISGLKDTAKLLEELGHEVSEDAPSVNKEEFALSYLTVLSAEVCGQTRAILRKVGKKATILDFEPSTQALAALGSTIDGGEYAEALDTLSVFARRTAGFFEKYDVLLTPTLSSPPVPIGSLQISAAESLMIRMQSRLHAAWILKALHIIEMLAGSTFNFIPYTAIFNVTGQPAMSVPLCQSRDGLPIGMQFAARFGDEATLFRLAGQLERAKPWFDKLPPGLPY
jgi:amidase